ncbi:MAG TPA: phosphoribosylanthranilate isomerase [Nitrosomonas sp.]|nr:phosphoribosylanthranilate isomerase [Nitrosomonas sp.]HMW20847.1 phosphoribosylanthranilate isomerase [Nitrosomonas sp.]HMW68530.1 phosphoribosylanthranilate isomerase [Nitrosomonas sp.]HMY60758.1 phosphoribosylanthranilate isomerase [Nitrosomonas sp.]HMY90419.1 phosphoribosylanthranilate isomerase [Nitrosomonas sp.]
MRTRVKICGITRTEDALAAISSGADAIGFVFWQQSARNILPQQARPITKTIPAFVTTVGVYVDPTVEWVHETATIANLGLLQFHGNESPEFCDQFSLPYVKALRIKEDMDLLEYANRYQSAKALLLDTYSANLPGGTGEVFDWTLIPANLPLPIILSGGLTPDNVVHAIAKVKPWAVDVSSGVEASKGIKDINKISAFMQRVKNCECI